MKAGRMHIIRSLRGMERLRQAWPVKANDKRFQLGFVPTMGHLHRGHEALLLHARRSCRWVVCSIFVNPHQFNRTEDYVHYPRTFAADKRVAAAAGCDALFCPHVGAFYSEAPRLRFDFSELEATMEGAGRPGHFNGVALVLSRLFHLIRPSVAYFGEKDWQQCLVVRRLVSDLAFPLRLEWMETVREPSGLAYSSRNSRLSAAARKRAALLHATLLRAASALRSGRSPQRIQQEATDALGKVKGLQLEYFSVVDSYSLVPAQQADAHKSISLCVAAQLEAVRLIDHMRVQMP